jgi:hypothetical protein
VQRADSSATALFAGTTKGIRIANGSVSSTIEGVDNTGTGSFQPLVLNGTTLTLQANGGSNALTINTALQVNAVATTASTSSTTGALISGGGIGAAGAIYAGQEVTTGSTTIGSLPACNAGRAGARYLVTNGQTTPTFLGTVSTTGGVIAPVTCNGSAWIYG